MMILIVEKKIDGRDHAGENQAIISILKLMELEHLPACSSQEAGNLEWVISLSRGFAIVDNQMCTHIEKRFS